MPSTSFNTNFGDGVDQRILLVVLAVNLFAELLDIGLTAYGEIAKTQHVSFPKCVEVCGDHVRAWSPDRCECAPRRR